MKKTDKLNKEVIKALKPCKDRFDNYLNHYKDFDSNLEEFILLENITYKDKVWVVTKLFTRDQNVKWSLLCASKVLSIFESAYPNDKRPRQALEAAENFLNNPNEETMSAASYAADAAAAASASSYAARATASAYASAYAANAAYYAAYADAVEEVNLLLMLECL